MARAKKSNASSKTKTISISLSRNDSDILTFLDRLGEVTGLNRSVLIKHAVREYSKEIMRTGTMQIPINPAVVGSGSLMEFVAPESQVEEQVTVKSQSEPQNTPLNTEETVTDESTENTVEQPAKKRRARREKDEQTITVSDDMFKNMLGAGMKVK